MRRLEVEPTLDAIKNSVASDQAGRNKDVIEFLEMIDKIEGPYSILLDAPWGDGKTFFVKTVEQVMRSLNPSTMNDRTRCMDELSEITDKLCDIKTRFLPFYFNAWQNDFCEDPISALLASMGAEFKRNDELKSRSSVDIIISAIDAAVKLFHPNMNVGDMARAVTGKSLVEAFEDRKTIREKIDDLAEHGIDGIADKIVIFIDELDRCRPDFSVRLLEQTKSLFQSKDIIVVSSSDSVQLAKAVAGMYGDGFDSAHFLERFFDARLSLTPVDSYAVANGRRYYRTSDWFDDLVAELLGRCPLTIRDCMRLEKLDDARIYCKSGRSNSVIRMVTDCAFLPLLIFIQRDEQELFRRITRGVDFDAIYEYGKEYEAFNDILDSAVQQLRNYKPDQDSTQSEDIRRGLARDLSRILYDTRRDKKEFNDAERRIKGINPDAFNPRVYKSLAFPPAHLEAR